MAGAAQGRAVSIDLRGGRSLLRVGRILTRGAVGVLIAVLVMTVAQAPGRADERADLFTVTVPVDATAANANAARDAARRDGARHAFDLLIQRLTQPSDRGRVPKVGDAALNDLIVGFEVANEHTSGVRYIADYSFGFRPDAVRRLLRQAGVPFAETQSKALLVLPVMQADGHMLLWEPENVWRQTWTSHPPQAGLVPLVMPSGDAADAAAIDAAAAAAGDDAHLQAISQRYGGVDVLVTRATLKTAGAHSVDITSTRYTPGSSSAPQHWIGSYAATAGQSDADLMAQAAAGVSAQLQDAWKSTNLLNYSQSGTVAVTVPVADLQGWIAVRQQLTGIPAIERTEIQSLDPQSAHLIIHYYGDQNQLRTALAQRNLELSGTDPDWILALHGSAPR
jgi:hypothetical protein